MNSSWHDIRLERRMRNPEFAAAFKAACDEIRQRKKGKEDVGKNYQGPGIYKHYKGNVYEVLGLALDEGRLTTLVVYRPIKSGDTEFLDQVGATMWTRLLDDFNSRVHIPDNDGGFGTTPRFQKIEVDISKPSGTITT